MQGRSAASADVGPCDNSMECQPTRQLSSIRSQGTDQQSDSDEKAVQPTHGLWLYDDSQVDAGGQPFSFDPQRQIINGGCYFQMLNL